MTIADFFLLLFIRRLIFFRCRRINNNKQMKERKKKKKQIQRLQKPWRQQRKKNSTAFFWRLQTRTETMNDVQRNAYRTSRILFFFPFLFVLTIVNGPNKRRKSRRKIQIQSFASTNSILYLFFFSANFHNFADWKFSNFGFVPLFTLKNISFLFFSLHAKENFI